MLTIRLSRVGKKNKPMYRVIISEKARDPFGRSLEILGFYNPYSKELQVKSERVNYWLSVGAQLSASVNNLFVLKGITKGDKKKTYRVNTEKQLKKREDKVKAEKEAKEAQAVAEAKVAEEAKATAEAEKTASVTPTVETPTVETPTVETPTVETPTVEKQA
jgi:small subunit ribosomal protein S16